MRNLGPTARTYFFFGAELAGGLSDVIKSMRSNAIHIERAIETQAYRKMIVGLQVMGGPPF